MTPRAIRPIPFASLLVASYLLVLPAAADSDAAAADPIPGFGVLVAVIAILAAIGIARHKRRDYESD